MVVTDCLILLQVQVITFMMGSAISLRKQNHQRKWYSRHPLFIGEDRDAPPPTPHHSPIMVPEKTKTKILFPCGAHLIVMLQSLHAVTCHCITYQVLSTGFFTYCILFKVIPQYLILVISAVGIGVPSIFCKWSLSSWFSVEPLCRSSWYISVMLLKWKVNLKK